MKRSLSINISCIDVRADVDKKRYRFFLIDGCGSDQKRSPVFINHIRADSHGNCVFYEGELVAFSQQLEDV